MLKRTNSLKDIQYLKKHLPMKELAPIYAYHQGLRVYCKTWLPKKQWIKKINDNECITFEGNVRIIEKYWDLHTYPNSWAIYDDDVKKYNRSFVNIKYNLREMAILIKNLFS